MILFLILSNSDASTSSAEQQLADELADIDLNDSELAQAASKIQKQFRGLKKGGALAKKVRIEMQLYLICVGQGQKYFWQFERGSSLSNNHCFNLERSKHKFIGLVSSKRGLLMLSSDRPVKSIHFSEVLNVTKFTPQVAFRRSDSH